MKLIVTVEVPDKFIGTLPVTDSLKDKLGKIAGTMGIKVLNVEVAPSVALEQK